jgi:C4-dicarboxylate-specific signal transduction histidine kinase
MYYCCLKKIFKIINNAKDAVSNKEEKLIFINTNIKNEKFVIEILDSGEGISTEIINRIFEPYFTTKHQSIGTGLGLSFTYNILKRYHNASFKVENKNFNFKEKEYLGASFTIYLPVNK